VLADVHRRGFLAAGATDVRIIAHAVPFAAALRTTLSDLPAGAGVVVLGSGAIPLATAADRLRLVAAAAGPAGTALANNRYSGDVVAITDAARSLADLPNLLATTRSPRCSRAAGSVIDLHRRAPAGRSRWRGGPRAARSPPVVPAPPPGDRRSSSSWPVSRWGRGDRGRRG
jgi:hypothetical protein